MKLIDLLMRELPKRGGWPDGADWCVYHDIDDEVSFGYRLSPLLIDGTWTTTENDSHWLCRGDFHHQNSSDFNAAIVTRDQYESALAASQNVEWSGDGLPPVGCECERSWCGDNWLSCTVLFMSTETVVVKLATREAAYGVSEVKFRPIRTEVDKKREEAAKEMLRNANVDTERMSNASLRNCLSIYDAIAACKIPGVKLEG